MFDNPPRVYGGFIEVLVGDKTFRLVHLFTSSFGLSLFRTPLLLNNKTAYAVSPNSNDRRNTCDYEAEDKTDLKKHHK